MFRTYFGNCGFLVDPDMDSDGTVCHEFPKPSQKTEAYWMHSVKLYEQQF